MNSSCIASFVGHSDIAGIGVRCNSTIGADVNVRRAFYVQAFLGLAAFLPSSQRFCEALFLSSFGSILALNVAALYFVDDVDLYHGLTITCFNTMLLVPVTIALTRLVSTESLATASYSSRQMLPHFSLSFDFRSFDFCFVVSLNLTAGSDGTVRSLLNRNQIQI